METEMLNHCDQCSADVDAALMHCPLCGTKLTDAPCENTLYPELIEKEFVDRRSLMDDTLLFVTFIFIVGSILLNIIFWNGVPWFMAVAAPILYTWILVRVTILTDIYPGHKALLNMAGIMGMMLAFDFVGGWHGWSYEIVLPFVLVAGLVYIDIYAWIHKTYWRDNLMYAILFIGLCFIPLALYFAGLSDALAPMLLSSIAGTVTILGILRFAVRRVRGEMRKRLHI